MNFMKKLFAGEKTFKYPDFMLTRKAYRVRYEEKMAGGRREVRSRVDDLGDADVVSSELVGMSQNFHAVTLDIDIPAALYESSTPNHYHLYIEKAITWPQYVRIIDALADAGIVEKGYADISIRRGATQLRPPYGNKFSPDDKLRSLNLY